MPTTTNGEMDSPPSPTKVTKERVEAKEYYFRSKRDFGSCLIINIRETLKKIAGGTFIRKFRTGSEAEVEKLKFAFGHGYYHTDEIRGGKDVLGEVKRYIEQKVNNGKQGNFKSNDIFVCVILAFGGPGFFYDTDGEKIPLSRVVEEFQSCADLFLKPKIFIVQTCSIDLRRTGKHLFDDGGVGKIEMRRWPREADILIYESNISGEYDWHPGLIKNDPNKIKGVPGLRSCTFIKVFCETIMKDKGECMEKEGTKKRIEFNEVILGTNLKLQKFINNKMNWDLRDGTWSITPRLPMVTDQLTRPLYVPRSS